MKQVGIWNPRHLILVLYQSWVSILRSILQLFVALLSRAGCLIPVGCFLAPYSLAFRGDQSVRDAGIHLKG